VLPGYPVSQIMWQVVEVGAEPQPWPDFASVGAQNGVSGEARLQRRAGASSPEDWVSAEAASGFTSPQPLGGDGGASPSPLGDSGLDPH